MNFLKNLKIGARLGLGFGLVLVLLIAVAVLSTSQLGRVNDNVLYFSENTMPSLKAVAAMRSDPGDIRRLEANHIMVSTEAEMDEFETRISKSRNSLETGLKGYEKLLSDDEDKKRWQAASSATAEYVALWDKLRPMSRKTATDPTAAEAAHKLLFGDSRKAFAAATAGFENMWEYNSQLGVKAAKDSQAAYSAAMLMLSLLSGLACMLGIWAAWFITRSITRPINQAVKVAQTVAAGDLTSEIDVTSRDETGQLLTALRAMNESLVGIVSNVRQSSDSIATGSAQIATGNADLSQRTEEQASNLQQTAASMEQLTSTVRQNSDTARQANQLASSAAAAAAKGGQMVGQVVKTMEQPAVCEAFIEGRELTASVIGSPAEVLPLGEIDFSGMPSGSAKIVCYAAKWDPQSPEYQKTPSVGCRLDAATTARVKKIARTTAAALGLRDIARLDLRLDNRGGLYVIDVNPNCDLGEQSGFPKAGYRAGLNYEGVLQRVLARSLSEGRRFPVAATA